MTRAAPLILALVLIGGCHRVKSDALPADAQAEAQAKTSAKAQADIAAAEEAAGTPLPEHGARQAKPAKAAAKPADDAGGAADLAGNETAPH